MLIGFGVGSLQHGGAQTNTPTSELWESEVSCPTEALGMEYVHHTDYPFTHNQIKQDSNVLGLNLTLEAQLPIYWVPVLGSLYKLILSITQEPTI